MIKNLNLEIIKTNIPTYSSEKLCEMIVCNMYFSCFKEVSISCMEELSKRRINGDLFNFEKYIDDSYNEMPQLNVNIPNLQDVLQQAINGNKI